MKSAQGQAVFEKRALGPYDAEDRKVVMSDSGPEAGIKGIVEDVKGKAKEVVGNVTDNENLTEEGKAQQDKAEAQRDVAKKEAEADAARGAAATAEKKEELHQNK